LVVAEPHAKFPLYQKLSVHIVPIGVVVMYRWMVAGPPPDMSMLWTPSCAFQYPPIRSMSPMIDQPKPDGSEPPTTLTKLPVFMNGVSNPPLARYETAAATGRSAAAVKALAAVGAIANLLPSQRR